MRYDRVAMRFLALLLALLVGCAAASNEQRDVSFATDDGGVVHGDEFGAGDHAVLLAHGGRFTKESWSAQVPAFVAAGYRVLAIDFRGRGKSHGGDQPNAMRDAYLDVVAAVRYLRASGATEVSIVGASFGGWASARASTEVEPGEIDRLVLLAHAEIPNPEEMTSSKLFLVARDDVHADGELRLPGVRDQFERAPEPKELVVVDGAAHAQFLFESDRAERTMNEILRFLHEPVR